MSHDLHPLGRPTWSHRQRLLGAGFAVIGLLAWWQLQAPRDEDGARPPRDRLPDYTVSRFSAVETDAAGRPSRHLTAETLRHYAAEDVSELEQPRLALYQTEGPPWLARSNQGLVLAGGDQVRLMGNVQLDREASQDARPAHLATERIDIWRQQGLAETDLPVRIISDGDTLDANGMRLWYQEPTRTSFHGRARVRLAPEQEPSQP